MLLPIQIPYSRYYLQGCNFCTFCGQVGCKLANVKYSWTMFSGFEGVGRGYLVIARFVTLKFVLISQSLNEKAGYIKIMQKISSQDEWKSQTTSLIV